MCCIVWLAAALPVIRTVHLSSRDAAPQLTATHKQQHKHHANNKQHSNNKQTTNNNTNKNTNNNTNDNTQTTHKQKHKQHAQTTTRKQQHTNNNTQHNQLVLPGLFSGFPRPFAFLGGAAGAAGAPDALLRMIGESSLLHTDVVYKLGLLHPTDVAWRTDKCAACLPACFVFELCVWGGGGGGWEDSRGGREAGSGGIVAEVGARRAGRRPCAARHTRCTRLPRAAPRPRATLGI